MRKRILGIILSILMLFNSISIESFASSRSYNEAINPGITTNSFASVVEDLFTDVPANDWTTSAIQYVYENGIMTGKGDGTFGTYDSLTRAEFVMTLYSMEGKPSVTYQNIFEDVSDGEWYSNAIIWANQNSISNGYGTEFGISDNITREQLALMIKKFSTDVCGYSTEYLQEALDSFSDKDDVSSWALEAVSWAVTKGIISGTGDGKLMPGGFATRAECAAILRTFCNSFNYFNDTSDEVIYTRGEWVSLLMDKLGYSSAALDTYIIYYYADTKDTTYGDVIEAAKSYGIINPSENDAEDVPLFYPDELATREFGAMTISNAMGYYGDYSIDCDDFSSLIYPNEVSVIVINGYIKLVNNSFYPNEAMTQRHKNIAFNKMDAINNGTIINENYENEIVYNDNVVYGDLESITDYTVVENSDGTYNISLPADLSANNIFSGSLIVLPANDTYYTGLVLEVDSVSTNGTTTNIIAGEPSGEIEDIYNTIDIQGSADALLDKITVNEGVEVIYIEIDEESPSVDSASGSIGGNSSYTLGLNVDIGDNAKLTGNIKIKSPKIDYIIDVNPGFFSLKVEEFMVSISNEMEVTAEFEYTFLDGHTLSSNYELFRIPFATPMPGLTIDVVFYLTYDISGKVSITYTIGSQQGLHIVNGTTRVINDINQEINLTWLEAEARAGIQMNVNITLCSVFDLYGIALRFGPAAKASIQTHLSATPPLTCIDGVLYLYAYMDIGADTIIGELLEDTIGFALKVDIFTESNSPLKKSLHFENGIFISDCTYGNGNISGYITAGDTSSPLTNARIMIYNDTTLLNIYYTDNEGNYYIENLSAGSYTLRISATNYQTTTFEVIVDKNNTTYVETIMLVGRNDESSGTVYGSVVNALDGSIISNTTYSLRNGLNNIAGEIVDSGNIEENYTFELASGNYTLEVGTDGFITNTINITIISGCYINQNIVLSPTGTIVDGDNLRIVLTWGDTPGDLDSHLVATDTNDSILYHTYYVNKEAYINGTRVAALDIDVTNSYGPETTTIYQIQDNEIYDFYIHDYTNLSSSYSLKMSNSNAMVKVYAGDALIATYSIPVNREGTLWHVFRYNAATKELIAINEFTYSGVPNYSTNYMSIESIIETDIQNNPKGIQSVSGNN